MTHAFHPSTREAEAGGSKGQPGLQELVPWQAPKQQRNPVSNKQKIYFVCYSVGIRTVSELILYYHVNPRNQSLAGLVASVFACLAILLPQIQGFERAEHAFCH